MASFLVSGIWVEEFGMILPNVEVVYQTEWLSVVVVVVVVQPLFQPLLLHT